ncbi:hypothetical protein [Sphingobacterium deserti]|uniref:Uncharacterized protein n=1 Tax=Sphingobacterium deserti TaxID=1229276 RepID=A0A0B8T9Z8_9SPHI|nr:hypothetical protein [Sphingobacterium deserti]KGE15599.1 hypothetical protein DI53_0703 [Sphingobacterium deserti]
MAFICGIIGQAKLLAIKPIESPHYRRICCFVGNMYILMNLKITIVLVLLSFLAFISCEKGESVQEEYVGKVEYRLLSLNSHERMDLNFDGIKDSDLLNEVETFYNKPLYINFDSNILNALWMEPSYDNQKIGFLPLYHPPGTPVNYVPVQNIYRFKIISDGLLRTTHDLENNNYTFTMPKEIKIERGGGLTFTARQRFRTSDGIVEVGITAVYQRQ